ncbi:E3 SUMO-protein ligase PIAS1-like [Artemia franciscana]|uniref:E3 SUMO-protein ligase PIAS2 n=1 Tax=Artemia franciscana TaxID=6661 RepID=A0AA88IFF8_ARTSF|nr:hypothetical protein QYM36_001839 [Artemia franciscana]KAK2723316.1 hypothetical protein QYM36_001839 [Artemia franciscana]KAK2723317.1 hypothetical protein QYM36_001839 [Artemia franciscana]
MSDQELRTMVLAFRVSELTMLLNFAGKNRAGRKQDLQQRAVDLIKMKNPAINTKIKELYRAVGQSLGLPNVDPSTIPMPSAPPPSYQQQQGTPIRLIPDPVHSAAQKAVERSTLRGQNPYTTTQSYGGQSATRGYPIQTDVKLKKLPFYDVLAELIKPSSLIPSPVNRFQEAQFQFHLTPQQASEIASNRDIRRTDPYSVQVQIRFALLETTSEQDDCFPSNVSVKVNGKAVQLPNPIPTNKPGVEPKRPPRPVNISLYCKLAPIVANVIAVSWTAEISKNYILAAYVVRKLSSQDLLQRMQKKGTRPIDYTRGLIKDKLKVDNDSEIALTSLRVSLNCPLGKMRMSIPCRPTTCSHLQCFDASLFLQMNERKPTWVCPVCDKAILYDNLIIDEYFTMVLDSRILPSDCTEIEMKIDSSWEPKMISAKPNVPSTANKGEVFDLDDIDEVLVVKQTQPTTAETEVKPKEVEEVILIDSDSDEPALSSTNTNSATQGTSLNNISAPPLPPQPPMVRPPSPDIIELD